MKKNTILNSDEFDHQTKIDGDVRKDFSKDIKINDIITLLIM